MTIEIKGNLILEKNTVYEEDLKVNGNIFGKDGNRYDLKVKGNINCMNIDCMNIDCKDINCMNINCMNIDCRNIDCLDIDCENINYYAVCFAYYNIKCKSIKGRRDNCKHFVLDGEITIKEEKVCDKCGSVLK